MCRSFTLALLLLLSCSGGCDTKKPGPQRAAVAGRITLDGESIQQGSIAFIPTGSTSGMTSGGPIQDGHFSIPLNAGVVVGKNRVEIHAARKTGRKVPAAMGQPGEMADEQVEAVPARYNTYSTLEREIVSGDNELTFDLSTK
jgi:hypothetical protein